MSDAMRKNRHGIALRTDPGVQLVAGEIILPVNVGGYGRASVQIRQTAALDLPGGADEVDFYLETSYDASAGIVAASGELLDESAGINDIQQTFTVDDTTTFEVGDVIRMDQERMLVTALDGAAPGVLTVERGHGGDPRATHANNAPIDLQQASWISLGNIHYATADDGDSPVAECVVGSDDLPPATFNDVSANVADDTVRALPLGAQLRLRVAVNLAGGSGYQYEAHLMLIGD